MAYSTIHTNYGLQLLSQAESSGIPINLIEMAVGDGNGNDTTPSQGQTQLVRERFRATINRVYQNADDPLRFTAELVIPASAGGFTLREVGVFDDTGSLFVVGNLPATYKPESDEGAYADTVVRVDFLVSNASTITLQIDPNVVVVTQQWISNNVTAATIIPGGTTGQVLSKQTNADGDYVWIDPAEANVRVDIVEDRQTLAASQTVVTLVNTITYGLAVYIEGVRLNRGSAADEWLPDATDNTKLTLGQSYPDGTSFLGVNNEPAGSAPAPLEKSKNLSDVPNKATARGNLDVFSKSETRQMAPAGLVASFARYSAPTGWLKANGAAVSRTAYADLFAAIGTTFGAGDGVNTFNLPDLRGEFIRGWDDGRGVDASRNMGSAQGSQNLAHNHTASTSSAGRHEHSLTVRVANQASSTGSYSDVVKTGSGATFYTSQDGDHTHTVTIGSSGGNEARPRNIALLACIKF